MKRPARLAPPGPPTQGDLEAGGLASSQMSFIYRMLASGAPHSLTMIQVAQRLGWRRPTVQALFERAHRLRVADRCAECSRWLLAPERTWLYYAKGPAIVALEAEKRRASRGHARRETPALNTPRLVTQ